MNFENIIERVIDGITGKNDERRAEPDVRPASEDPHGDPADAMPTGHYPGEVRPASEDPYGDPADVYNGQQVLPASQDPYGDPADSPGGLDPRNVRPASEDPYGDPADEEEAQPARGRWPF
jgi:hypothetical protein